MGAVAEYLDLPLEPDPVVEAYKRDVDLTLLDANLRLTPLERLRKLRDFCAFLDEVRGRAAADPTAVPGTTR